MIWLYAYIHVRLTLYVGNFSNLAGSDSCPIFNSVRVSTLSLQVVLAWAFCWFMVVWSPDTQPWHNVPVLVGSDLVFVLLPHWRVSTNLCLQVYFLIGCLSHPRACRSLGVGVVPPPCGLLLGLWGFEVRSLRSDQPPPGFLCFAALVLDIDFPWLGFPVGWVTCVGLTSLSLSLSRHSELSVG